MNYYLKLSNGQNPQVYSQSNSDIESLNKEYCKLKVETEYQNQLIKQFAEALDQEEVKLDKEERQLEIKESQVYKRKSLSNESATRIKKYYAKLEKAKSPESLKHNTLKIVFFGQLTISISEAHKICAKQFKKHGLIYNKALTVLTKEYTDCKRIDLSKKLVKDNYDAIILGSHPHSLTNIPNKSIEYFIKNNNLNLEVYSSSDRKITKSRFIKYVKQAITNHLKK